MGNPGQMGEGRDDPSQQGDDDERRKHQPQGGDDATRYAFVLLADEGGGVHRDDAGGTLSDGEIVRQLLLGGPALVLHHLPLEDGQHSVAAAEGHDPYLRKGEE